MPYVLTPTNRVAIVARHVDKTEGPFSTAGDRKEAIKCACARARVPYDSGMINTALDWIDNDSTRKARRWPTRGNA